VSANLKIEGSQGFAMFNETIAKIESNGHLLRKDSKLKLAALRRKAIKHDLLADWWPLIDRAFNIQGEALGANHLIGKQMTHSLKWYRWDTDIGEVLACAENPNKAREQVMSALSADDGARDELTAALLPSPEVIGDKPQAFVSWHQ